MAERLKEIDVLKDKVQDLTKLKDENQMLKEKNEKLIIRNKEWKKMEEEWIKSKLERDIIIKELKKKNEDKKNVIDDLQKRRDAEKKAMIDLRENMGKKDCEKLKNEIETWNNKYNEALIEIRKLARFVRIFGKNV